MKKLIITSVLAIMTTSTFASDFENRTTLEESSVQTVARVFADLFEATTFITLRDSTEESSYEHRKIEALKIQNDIQEYSASGNLSIYLAEKINIVNSINSELSEAEALDVLVIATSKILQ